MMQTLPGRVFPRIRNARGMRFCVGGIADYLKMKQVFKRRLFSEPYKSSLYSKRGKYVLSIILGALTCQIQKMLHMGLVCRDEEILNFIEHAVAAEKLTNSRIFSQLNYLVEAFNFCHPLLVS